VRAIAGIASGGVLKRPHVVEPDQLPADYRQAIYDSYPGSGDVTIPITPAVWETITEGMALTTNRCAGCTAAASHLENIDFAGKTGTAQVVNHSAGMKSLGTGAERANAWFVGIAPRRNPDIAVVVLVEHGGWGAEASAPLAARVIETFVDKQRRLDNNLQEAKVPSQVEVGAVWSEKPEAGVTPEKTTTVAAKDQVPAMQGGHFTVPAQ
jgi:penicillin-binding protein 2